jgi:hypothetical protein
MNWSNLATRCPSHQNQSNSNQENEKIILGQTQLNPASKAKNQDLFIYITNEQAEAFKPQLPSILPQLLISLKMNKFEWREWKNYPWTEPVEPCKQGQKLEKNKIDYKWASRGLQAPSEPTFQYWKLNSNCEIKLTLLNEVEKSKALSVSQNCDPQAGPSFIKPEMESKWANGGLQAPIEPCKQGQDTNNEKKWIPWASWSLQAPAQPCPWYLCQACDQRVEPKY